jgi:hypothetical protein
MKKLTIFLFLAFAIFQGIESYAQTTFKLNESFEGTFLPTGWTSNSVLGANIWMQGDASILNLFPPFPDGDFVATVAYEGTGGDDWLITPQIMDVTAGDSLIFYWQKRFSDGPYPPDSCIVRLSTTTATPNTAFTETLMRICVHCTPVGTQIWYRVSIPLTAYIGQDVYIAFQHKDVDGHGMGLDLVQVKNEDVGISNVSNSSFILNQNYPNPFNKSTLISFELKTNDFVKLTVLDVLGKEVATLVNQTLTAGVHNVTFNPTENLTSGVYFYKLETSNFKDIKIMTLEK